MRTFRYSSSPDDGNPPERIGAPRASKKLLLSASMAGLMIASAGAQGQTTEWTGAVSNDWMTPGNWTNGLPSAASGTARIDIPNEAVISGSAAEARSLNVGISNPANLSIINGGTLTNRGASIGIFSTSNSGVEVIGPGSRWTLTSTLSVGEYGTGSLLVSNGGVVDNPGALLVGLDSGGNGPGTGTVTVTGAGSLLATNWPEIGGYGNGHLNILDGGRVTTPTSATLAIRRAGTVNVSGSGSLFEIGGNMEIGWRGTGVATVADAGLLEVADTITLAAHADGSGTLAIGAVAGQAAVAPGAVNAGGGIVFGPGDGRIVFNHTGENHLFAPAISGNGRIDVVAGKTSLTGEVSAFTGEINVTGGTLSTNNTLRGTLLISQTGRLSGTGMFGDVTVASGGTIAPGNSIGMMIIDGDATFSRGSRYEVEVDPAGVASDVILVTGKATLDGGSVIHVGEAGTYRRLSKYRILNAAGGVEGTFDEVRSDFTFLDPRLTYGAYSVDLTLERNDIAFASAASTDNQTATASALDTLRFGDPIYDAVVVLDEPQARSAFEQLSGEIHASATSALIGSSGVVRGVVENRLRGTLGGGGPVGAIAAYASLGDTENVTTPEAPTADTGLWGRGFGSWARIRGSAGISGMRHEEGGFLIGADRDLADAWALPAAFDAFRLGIFGGYSRSTFALDTRTSSGASDNAHLGVYMSAEAGALRLSGGITHTEHRASSVRRVIFPGFDERLTASYRARTTQLLAETGYRIPFGTLAFEPFAGLAYVIFDRDRYRESGGAAALDVSRDRQRSASSTIGLRGFADFLLGDLQAKAHGMIGWRHMMDAGNPTTEVSLAGTGPFRISGSSPERNTAIMEAGIDLNLNAGTTLSLSYDGRRGARSAEHGVSARVHASF